MTTHRLCRILLLFTFIVAAPMVFAQQTGSISGKVTATDGSLLPGVTVEARSNVLPQPRVSVTDETGEYRLPQLVPGAYTVTYSLAGLQTVTRNVGVQLNQNATVDVALGVAGVSENITVTAEATLVDRSSAEIQTGVSDEQIQALPIAQEYRDLQKLIPGVSVSTDLVRGPSSGGSGQDNVYLFDGVNVTMPLFGVLVAEPATHDLAQYTVLKGGAKAVDFERSGGFSVDSVSKSGTNKFSGEVSYQVLNSSFISDQKAGAANSSYDEDKDWATASLGGPVVSDQLYFYGSYYRPTRERDNAANLYGELPGFLSERTEWFGKLTYTPTQSWLINGSYRDSTREETGSTYASTSAGTIGIGYDNHLKIGTLEGSWIMNQKGFASFKFTDFQYPGGGKADFLVDGATPLTPGTVLNVNNLDTLGQLQVPTAIGTNPTQSAFVTPFIERYGYLQNGVRTGGGTVGFGRYATDDDDFFRKSGQLGFDYSLGSGFTHDLHFGYQRYTDSEDRFQTANGYGLITIPGGTVNCPASACGSVKPAFFQAVVSQQSTGVVPSIHSEFKSQNIELNDTMRINDWTFSAGLMLSEDTLYGQGLREADNVAGVVSAPGVKYKMHETPFEDQIQPRLSGTWAYNGSDTVYVSYARYYPAANSDARAASWDRNLVADINAYFDASGVLLGLDPVRSSSGKLFVDDIKPRQTDEYMIGTGQQLSSGWSARAYARYRLSNHFWEDTNNNARIRFGAGVPGVKQELYVPDLAARLAAIGSGSTYVITELDGAFTKYYEGTLETDWHGGKTFIRGSYTWSHYYGNFDQDNTTFNSANDTSTFIGSSNIGDGAGRQLWDNKYGDLRGDRRHVLKLYGTYSLPWNASVGAFGIYQSGQPYQLESFIPYAALTTSTSDTNRYAEPAGRRKTPDHHQVDLNYTQNIGLPRSLNLQLRFDVFNVYDKQTGFNYETRVGTLGVCDPTKQSTPCAFETGLSGSLAFLKTAPAPRTFYDPRRFQIAAVLQF
jgi:hypothetical protein